MIGFARRAGKTVIGTELICRELPKGTVELAIVAQNASLPTKKRLANKTAFRGVKLVEVAMTTEELGALLGKSGAVAAVAITDARFADEIIKAADAEK